MKIKFLLVSTVIIIASFSQAQGQISPKQDVALKLKYALERFGTPISNMLASPADFNKDTSDTTYVLYIYRRDTTVNIGFKIEETDAVKHMYVYLSRSYLGTIDTFLDDLNFKRTSKSTVPGSFEYENADHNIYWQQDAENGMMMLIVSKKE